VSCTTYLFDASAVLERYLGERPDWKRKVDSIVSRRENSESDLALFIPTICIVEVFKVLAQKHFRERKIDDVKYKECLKSFRAEIHWGRIFYPYETNRYHITAVDEVLPLDYILSELEPDDRQPLSAVDLLLVTMASDLTFTNGSGDGVSLVTCDKRIKKVCDLFRSGHVRRRNAMKVPGPLDDPPEGRWPSPNVIYVPDWKGIAPPDGAEFETPRRL